MYAKQGIQKRIIMIIITIISWIRAKVSFAILRSALLCVRGSRVKRRRSTDVKERDLEIDKESAGPN